MRLPTPDNTTLLALDHEDERVPLIDAKEFLLRVEHAVGPALMQQHADIVHH
jgi:hypothetical protein